MVIGPAGKLANGRAGGSWWSGMTRGARWRWCDRWRHGLEVVVLAAQDRSSLVPASRWVAETRWLEARLRRAGAPV